MATAVTTFPTMALSKTKKNPNQTMWVGTPIMHCMKYVHKLQQEHYECGKKF